MKHTHVTTFLSTLFVFVAAKIFAADEPHVSASAEMLAPFLVQGLSTEESANPLVRSVSGVFADDRSILETPRGVTVITEALFKERGVDSLREVVAFAPSAYVPSRWGKATVPNIRGDTAEVFLNGQRRSYNLFGYYPSFNGVEALELVRGAPPAASGAGFFTGGFVNFATKQPKFVAGETVVTLRVGTWVPGETSFRRGALQIDHTAKLSDTFAWRASYEGQDGETFFRKNGVRDDRQDLFFAFTWQPHAGLSWRVNAQYLWQASPEVLGINRPSQELIDGGWYYTGNSANTFPFPAPIASTNRVQLPPEATLFSIGDFSNANVYHFQSLLTFDASNAWSLNIRTLLEHVNRRRYHSFEYAEWVEQTTLDQRIELSGRFEAFGFAHKTTSGIALRGEYRRSFTNYFNEYFYNYDITSPSRVFNHAASFSNSYFLGFPGPGGKLFFGAVFGSPETVVSRLWSPALFHQHELKISAQTSALIGLRAEGHFADAHDPLPPTLPRWEDDLQTGNLSWDASLTHRISEQTSVYATYQRTHSVNANVAGGGLLLVGSGELRSQDFRAVSELFELGGKFAFLENKMFLGLTAFQQTRGRIERGGTRDDILVRGLETEAIYQPHKKLIATLNATLADAHFENSAPFQLGGRSLYALYAAGMGPGGLGTGVGYSFGNQVPAGDWRLPGFSKLTVNGSVDYRFDSGFGAALTGNWQSHQLGNLDREYIIPAQFSFNAALSYQQKKNVANSLSWEARIEILNLTDETNWTHNGDTFANNVMIFREQPRRIEGWLKLWF